MKKAPYKPLCATPLLRMCCMKALLGPLNIPLEPPLLVASTLLFLVICIASDNSSSTAVRKGPVTQFQNRHKLLHRCRIVARIHCSNMFFYIRRPDGAIDYLSMARLVDQPWTFLLYLWILLLFKQYDTVAYNGVLTISNRVQNRRNGHDIRPSSSSSMPSLLTTIRPSEVVLESVGLIKP